MHPLHDYLRQTRRGFLTSTANGVGLAALASLLQDDVAHAAQTSAADVDPLALRAAHFAPLNGQKLPESMTKNVRFAFIQKDGAGSEEAVGVRIGECESRTLPPVLSGLMRVRKGDSANQLTFHAIRDQVGEPAKQREPVAVIDESELPGIVPNDVKNACHFVGKSLGGSPTSTKIPDQGRFVIEFGFGVKDQFSHRARAFDALALWLLPMPPA